MKTIFAIFILFGFTVMSCSKQDEEYAKWERLHDITYVFINPNNRGLNTKHRHIQNRKYEWIWLHARDELIIHDKGRIGDQVHLTVSRPAELSHMENIVMQVYVNGNLAVEMPGDLISCPLW